MLVRTSLAIHSVAAEGRRWGCDQPRGALSAPLQWFNLSADSTHDVLKSISFIMSWVMVLWDSHDILLLHSAPLWTRGPCSERPGVLPRDWRIRQSGDWLRISHLRSRRWESAIDKVDRRCREKRLHILKRPGKPCFVWNRYSCTLLQKLCVMTSFCLIFSHLISYCVCYDLSLSRTLILSHPPCHVHCRTQDPMRGSGRIIR